MLGNFISKMFVIPKQAFAGEIVDNRLNPLHLAIATTGYRIQSRILQIPDRFGFFSSGPPRLQVQQGLLFIVGACKASFDTVFLALVVLLCYVNGLPNYRRIAAVFSVMVISQVVMIYALGCWNPRRAPGYVWEDWKLQKD